MSNEISNSLMESGEAIFSAADYFLGIAQRIAASGDNTRIVLPGRGEVFLFPGRREYSADIPDMAEFFQAPAAQFEITALSATTTPSPGCKNLGELLWQAAFHASQGRLINDATKYDVVQFNYWPNLPRLPKTPNTARICALLTRHPTTIMLVHRKLGIDKEELYRVYSAAYCAGIARIRNLESTTQLRAPDSITEADLVTETTAQSPKQGMLHSLFSKISGL